MDINKSYTDMRQNPEFVDRDEMTPSESGYKDYIVMNEKLDRVLTILADVIEQQNLIEKIQARTERKLDALEKVSRETMNEKLNRLIRLSVDHDNEVTARLDAVEKVTREILAFTDEVKKTTEAFANNGGMFSGMLRSILPK